jgi:aminopeptidase N
VYKTAIKYGDETEWEFLWNKYKNSIDPVEKERIVSALGAALKISLRKRFVFPVLVD